MDSTRITVALTRLFHDEGHRVVFWNDPDNEFESALPSLTVDGVTILKLAEVGQLATKIRIERISPLPSF